MTWITTASGRAINLAHPNPDLICIRDIGYALSNINRFNGHSLRPISVAEHSLTVCEILQRHFGVQSPTGLLAALLHDAHEYLVGDIAQPVKQLMGDAWKVHDERIQRTVLRSFGVWTAYCHFKLWIHDADMHALTCEREQLMNPDADVWPCQVTHPAIDWVRYGSQGQFTADDWRQAFMDRYAELTFAIKQQHESAEQGDQH